NPHHESDTSASAADLTSAVFIEYYCFRQDGNSGGIGTLLVDNLQVGTAFTDVVPLVVPTRIPLNIQLSGNNAVLTWTDARFNLYSAPSVSGPNSIVWDATSPYTTPIGASQTYFQL